MKTNKPIDFYMPNPWAIVVLFMLFFSINVNAAGLTDLYRGKPANQPEFIHKKRSNTGALNETMAVPAKVELVRITGKVIDADGLPLPGVSIRIKGTSIGTSTDTNGDFSLDADANATITVTYTGYYTQEIALNGKNEITISLKENVNTLKELTVTALGVEKKTKALSYSSQKLDGTELSKVKETNLMNSLSGKVAGITISRSSSGAGGSVKVLLRGNKSASGSNQPLYVVDGIPLTNIFASQPISAYSGRDTGDGISNINPDDIESISVLKGASASVLYGSQAANGVILITTKKGKAGVAKVDFSSSYTMDQATYKPEFQYNYGQTAAGSTFSWGGKINNAADNLEDYFKTGGTFINSIALQSGAEKLTTYFSYANTKANGITDGNKLLKHNFNFRETAKFFDNKLNLDGSINIIKQQINNGGTNGLYFNPLSGLYLFPRGLDFEPYKKYEIFDPVRQINTQNWPFNEDQQQNPYWIINRNANSNKRNRAMLNLSAKYNIADWLSLQVRGNMDRTNDVYEAKIYAGTQTTLSSVDGRYVLQNLTTTQTYGDAILNYNKTFNDYVLSGVIGTSITDVSSNGQSFDSGTNGLYIPNFFAIQNLKPGAPTSNSLPESRQQLQAIFANINVAYKDWLFLDAALRNDWSSNLSYTPNGSYSYPSIGLSAILNQVVKLPMAINFFKVRASYAIVGNTVPVYITNPLNHLGQGGTVTFNTNAPFEDLKPEKSKSLEIGTELRFLNDKLSLDFTYYKTNTINQFFSIAVPPGTGYSNRYINGGDIQNSGIEVALGYNGLVAKDLKWSTNINFSANHNEVKKLASEVPEFYLTGSAVNTYYSKLVVGSSYGDIYSKQLLRDGNGNVVIGSTGTPIVAGGESGFVGNPNPKFQLGWNNNFTYKSFSLSFLFDGKFGGKVMSVTQAMLDKFGVSKVSGDARDNGGVTVNNVNQVTGVVSNKVDAQKWYGSIGGRDGVLGEYVYDATTVRLREISIGYSLPKAKLQNKFIKEARVSLVGRNLAYLYIKAPYDPELTGSIGNDNIGLDNFMMPATRSYGLNLNLTF